MRKTKTKSLGKSLKTKIIFSIVFCIFLIYSITLIFPFYYTVLNSFKSNAEFLDNVWKFPSQFGFSNYIKAFEENNIGQMFFNSAVLTFAGTLISMASASVMAYILSKYKFLGSGFLFTLAITFMLIPNLGTVSATYKLMVQLKLVDNLLGVLLLYGGPFGSTFLLLYSFFKGISWSYAEAAKIDGAGNFTVFFKIMLPQAKAGIIAVGFMVAIGNWNDYFTPFMYLPSMFTIATGLQDLSINATTTGAYTQMFAAMVVATIPIMIVFAFTQKIIMNNTVAGGLKG